MMSLKINKQKLMQDNMTILFHIGDKVFAPVMDKDKLDAIRFIAVQSADSLVEVNVDITVKEGDA